MSKIVMAVFALILLAIAAGYLLWMRGSGSAAKISMASDSSLTAAAPAPEPRTDKGVSPPPAKTTKAVSESDAQLPFQSGEVLEFVADVAKLTNVANLQLRILEQRNFFGKNAWHLQALAHTESPLRMVFELDDQFDSYSDSSSLSSLQYEMHLNERGQKIDSVQRMTTSSGRQTLGNATQTHVLPGTRDPLGLMQFLRTVDWSHTPQVRCPVYDGHKLYDIRAEYEGKASGISVPAGSFSTSKIEIHVYDGGAELKDAHFVLHLAENPARTPVLVEAVMPFATARVALAKATQSKAR